MDKLWFYTWQNIKDQTFSVSALLSLVWIKVYNILFSKYNNISILDSSFSNYNVCNCKHPDLICLNEEVSIFFYIANLISPYKIKSLKFLDMDRQ